MEKKKCATETCQKNVRKNEYCSACILEHKKMTPCKNEECKRKCKADYCYLCSQARSKLREPKGEFIDNDKFIIELHDFIGTKKITEKNRRMILGVLKELL